MKVKLESISSYAKRFGLIPKKSLGQNFIYDESLCDRIVGLAGDLKDQVVIEIGPGPGGLTRAILKHNPRKLTVVEIDQRSIDLLQDLQTSYPILQIIHSDALQLSLNELADNGKVHIISNLPYNIGTKLLIKWSREMEAISSITCMLQKEVVERICASISTKEYSRLSVILQLLFHTKKLFDVARDALYPKPKVTSSIVQLIPRSHPPSKSEIETLEKLTRFVFSMRRKKIAKSLGVLTSKASQILEELNINPGSRPEELEPEAFLRVSRAMQSAIE